MCSFTKFYQTYRTFQVSARKVRSGTEEQDQDQNAVVMADDIVKAEEDARLAENKVQRKDYLFHKTTQLSIPR